ncbi:X-Pro dipeptidyl-peptidase C-terminal non-catalytic domain-containing protein [Aspergillus insuetus]
MAVDTSYISVDDLSSFDSWADAYRTIAASELDAINAMPNSPALVEKDIMAMLLERLNAACDSLVGRRKISLRNCDEYTGNKIGATLTSGIPFVGTCVKWALAQDFANTALEAFGLDDLSKLQEFRKSVQSFMDIHNSKTELACRMTWNATAIMWKDMLLDTTMDASTEAAHVIPGFGQVALMGVGYHVMRSRMLRIIDTAAEKAVTLHQGLLIPNIVHTAQMSRHDGESSEESLYESVASVNLHLEDINIPLLTVANWGGFLLHLRGNVQGFLRACSELKYIRFIVGRHDLPFYYPEEVELQRSFLDAFCKGDDRVGWSRKGGVPPVDLLLRKGNNGSNNPSSEATFPRRFESEWPIARTKYTDYYLHPDQGLTSIRPDVSNPTKLTYSALGKGESIDMINFMTQPFETETEITGHIVAHLNVSRSALHAFTTPSDLDLFLTRRHFDNHGKEVFYTGTIGDPAPVTKGWLRVSLRKTNESGFHHESWLPQREYRSSDVQPVIPNDVYAIDVEMWPTNVVVEEGGRLAIEISSGDTQGIGPFRHDNKTDRPEATFPGLNHLHFGPKYLNHVTFPVIPAKENQGMSLDR